MRQRLILSLSLPAQQLLQAALTLITLRDIFTTCERIQKLLQRWGTSVVKYASGTSVCDSTSGFRTINRKAMAQLFVYNRFSYTLETIIQAGRLGLAIENVPIQINAQTRSSRLSSSMLDYLRKNGPVIFRSYSLYW